MVKAMSLLRSVRSVHSISVQLARTGLRQVAMPDHIRLFGECDAKGFPLSGRIEQAQFNLLRVLRVEGKVDTFAIPNRAQGIGFSRPHNGLRLIWHSISIPEFRIGLDRPKRLSKLDWQKIITTLVLRKTYSAACMAVRAMVSRWEAKKRFNLNR